MRTIRKPLPVQTTEQREALIFMKWARTIPVLDELIIHIANERHCTPQQGHMLRLVGVRAGVSDYYLPLPRGKFAGLWLELKKDRTCTLRENQKFWLAKMKVNGYQAVVAYGAQHAIDLVKEYLGEK